jgi:ATP-dependent DNA helicase RecG
MLTDDAVKYLRNKKLIEGRKPNFFISKWIAKSVNQQVEYTRNKGLNEDKCEALIVTALEDHKKLSRQKINQLLFDLLPQGLSNEQKRNRVDYILKKLSKSKEIDYQRKEMIWKLRNSHGKQD